MSSGSSGDMAMDERDPVRPAIRALEHSGIAKIALEGYGREDVTPLWFGESDLVTPGFVREAAKEALDRGRTFYSQARGAPDLRAAISNYLARIYGVEIDEARITAPGSTMLSCLIAGQCLLETGAEMIAVTPYWPNIRNVAAFCGAAVREVPLIRSHTGFALDLERLEAAIGPATRAIYLNSPSNPTGWVASRADLEAVLELCRRHGLGLISDEVYHRNVFEGRDPAPSVIELCGPDEPVFAINGFSKAWAMTGWRIGWLAAPRSMVEPMAVLAECDHTGPAAFAQAGAIAALERGETFLAWFKERLARNRAMVMNTLGAHPRVDLAIPAGAFYAFPAIEGGDGLDFARRALREARVGLAAGYSFGAGFESHVRLCFAISEDALAPALDRLTALLDRAA